MRSHMLWPSTRPHIARCLRVCQAERIWRGARRSYISPCMSTSTCMTCARRSPRPTACSETATAVPPSTREPVDVLHAGGPGLDGVTRNDLTATERRLLSDLFAIVEEHASDAAVEVDRERVEDAFVFACEHHADQRRRSGEDF